ncbi:hypothetical protein ACF3DV_34230 (plasmid) [Chlorogloeopsis fritschii PCC 9212]|jgi:hypothetical protein|uniref:Uncharacterized protein n=1 Tax=Chlorogloeopsis fritschii PCC 6912 TaxID=211165 RepID=A0A433NLK7_CHLFR|nr:MULTISPECIES: hypothetical protein [Chlorogloeopsis]MBF2004461.1 hypothetical protein [Chlorogloeopsis fritschii C42_A2020_084]MDM9383562.1 hypothetical protein [Chlorogloeopsis sp. ULAP01]RUR83783.1 hypothetical protein PCC6912_20260 [Chlorogloeopsis fritschii PCC 6912]
MNTVVNSKPFTKKPKQQQTQIISPQELEYLELQAAKAYETANYYHMRYN